ncbi:hypothetical protein E5163_04670 [Marinicauda algicola]|uniref:DNA ligase D polymerase domain-containing protein n=1 Tax=Marinicauda algicola TaxID=2029849 RepID=A0A4S2H485_9PROT|nr:non-homologous end-joining DNA ligase [Marinicauda algicola]TGY90416.1 hypothetical protein E5163_04670 [Marinicauda algicola]
MSGGLTHPDRVYFPDAGVTKADYRDYLLGIAERILPHVARRPLSLVRCPDGIGGECFFQKHHARGMPDGFRPVEIEEKSGKSRDYLAIEDEAGLEACAQFGALELHPWGSTLADIEHPERVIFDLDPDIGYDFGDLKQTARDIADLLRTAGLEPHALLTGGKGIHVIAPLDRSAGWDEVKTFAQGLARALEANDPSRYVSSASKEKRKGRIFVDWLRNQRGATAIAPYSVRARPAATVATPVRWDELPRIEQSGAYTLKTLPRRLAGLKSDPWADYFRSAAPLREGALEWARGFL